MTTKGPRRSPSCRINDTSRNPTKDGRLRLYTLSLNLFEKISRKAEIFHNTILLLRWSPYKNNLLNPNRPQVPNCIFIRFSHELHDRWHIYDYSMGNFWKNYSNDSAWSSSLSAILHSQLILRTIRNSNSNYQTRYKVSFKNNTPILTHLRMCKPRPTPIPKINGRTTNIFLNILPSINQYTTNHNRYHIYRNL